MRWIACLGLLALLATTGIANAQATRTWVSGVGDDANPCSRTSPCKTFAGAISKTAAGGEINTLDPGGFGGVTITKALTIRSDSIEAGVLVAGTNGITVNAGATDTVVLSGLDIIGVAGTNGINVVQVGTLRVMNSTIKGFDTGINLSQAGNATVEVIDTTVVDNTGTGILGKPGAFLRLFLNRVRVVHNGGDGVMANATTGSANIKVSIKDSESSDNTGVGFVTYSNGNPTSMMIDSSSAFNNVNSGIAANGVGAIIRFTRSIVSANGTGVLQVSSGLALSYGTNSVDGNSTDGTFGTTPQK